MSMFDVRFRLEVQAPTGEDASRRFFDSLEPAMRDVTTRLQETIRQRVRRDTGALRRNIQTSVERSPSRGSVFGTLPQTFVEEMGRRRGARWPPRGALTGWLKRHNIPVSREWLVRRAISRKGIAARHTFEETLDEQAADIKERLMSAMQQMVESL